MRFVLRRRPRRIASKKSQLEYVAHKKAASNLVQSRLDHFNTIYGFTYNRVSIRNQRTRWGSCSRKGNLNFSYKVVLLPPALVDYIVVHELCHLGEFNHSRNFWDLVARTMPNHRELRVQLRAASASLR